MSGSGSAGHAQADRQKFRRLFRVSFSKAICFRMTFRFCIIRLTHGLPGAKAPGRRFPVNEQINRGIS